jgi:hypothetical protein
MEPGHGTGVRVTLVCNGTFIGDTRTARFTWMKPTTITGRAVAFVRADAASGSSSTILGGGGSGPPRRRSQGMRAAPERCRKAAPPDPLSPFSGGGPLQGVSGTPTKSVVARLRLDPPPTRRACAFRSRERVSRAPSTSGSACSRRRTVTNDLPRRASPESSRRRAAEAASARFLAEQRTSVGSNRTRPVNVARSSRRIPSRPVRA